MSRPGMPPARIPWRPSRLLCAGLATLTALAVASVVASDMPRPAAWGAGLLLVLHGGRLVRREWRRPARELVFSGGALAVDGQPAGEWTLAWRGPLAFVAWRDTAGRRHRLAWWPDTLPPPRRRELRLAAPAFPAARAGASVAP